jgi:hypothetical protein
LTRPHPPAGNLAAGTKRTGWPPADDVKVSIGLRLPGSMVDDPDTVRG